MANKTLFTSTERIAPSFSSPRAFNEIDDFLKSVLPDLLSRKQQALLLNMGTPPEENVSFFTDPQKKLPPTGLLVIPIWEHIAQDQIQNVLDILFSIGVYAPVQNLPTKAQILTNREQDVLRLLVIGKSYKTIAHSLSISLATVKFHMKNLYIKLNVGNKEDAIEWARHYLVEETK